MSRNKWVIIDHESETKYEFFDTEVQYVAHESMENKDYIVVCLDIEQNFKYYFNADSCEVKYVDENGHEIGELD